MSVRFVLRIRDLHGVARELGWPGSILRIGSDSSCDLLLSGRGIADHHCILELSGGAPVLRDVGVHTGTFINNERLAAPRIVAPGDRIYIGEYQLELLVSVPASPSLPYPREPAPIAPFFTATRATLVTLAVLAALAAALVTTPPAVPEPTSRVAGPPRVVLEPPPPPSPTAPQPPARKRVTVHHEVIPGELLADIAARYGISVQQLLEDNRLNPDIPPPAGITLTFAAHDPPLPLLRLRHQVEPGDTWAGLGERFALGIEQLRRYNPELRGELTPGSELIVWVDPQIERKRDEPVHLHFPVPPGALSVGAPSAGSLERGIALPASKDLYEQIFPQLQYGSSHTIELLQTAIASFRQRYRYRGVLVVANLSRPGGGRFPPHTSHQSGRDVDIWLPALKGTYQPRHLVTDRKPKTLEINWFAAWGLVESLLDTGEVRYIFLDRTLLPKLHDAAEKMGATPEQLARIDWQPASADPTPAQQAQAHAPVRHAVAHTGHIHVRFRCGRDETRCSERPEIEEP